MRTHTPGPWRACTEKGTIPQTLYGGIIAILHDSGAPDGYVAVIRANGDRADGWCPESLIHETMVSNAYLVAAAPALKAALMAALDQTEDGLHSDNCDEPACWVTAAKKALLSSVPPTAAAGTSADAGGTP